MTPEEKTALPSEKDVDHLLDLEVKKDDGTPIKFRTLVNDEKHPRVIVIFIRHFFCGFCELYVQSLAQAMSVETLEGMSPSTKLVIIGCGEPGLIADYKQRNSSAYEIYADPTRKTYDALGFAVTLARGHTNPDYVKSSFASVVFSSLVNNLKAGRQALSGGKSSQNGGELIWLDGKLKFINRMANTFDHMSAEDLKKKLEE